MDPLLEVLLTNAAAAAALAIAAWTAARLVRRPALVHALWLVAVLRLLAPPLVWVPVLPWSRPGPGGMARTRADAPTALAAARESLQPARAGAAAATTAAVRGPDAQRGARWQPATIPSTGGVMTGRTAWAVILLGALAVTTLSARRHSRFSRLLRCAAPAPAALAERAGVLAARLGLRGTPPVQVIKAPLPPLLWPTVRGPQLLLPLDLLDQLTDEERDALLVHELAHVRRRDHWVRLAEVSATALFWWYPLAWWMRRPLRAAEERCCDQWVLRVLPGSAHAYANGLLKTASLLADLRPLPAGASGAGPVRELESRLKEILMTRPLPQVAAPLRLALAALAVAGLTVFPTRAASTLQAETPAAPPPAAASVPPAHPVAAALPPELVGGVPGGVLGGVAGAMPHALLGESADPALDAERRALQQQRRALHEKELELERQSIELEARAEGKQLASEAARLRGEGKAEEATRVEKSIELNRRRLALQQRQLQLQAAASRLEAEAEAGEAATDDAAAERSRTAIEQKQQALQGEMEKAEREMEALEAEQRVEELRGSTDQLRQSLAEHVQALREALPEAGAQKPELEREMARLEAALQALQGTPVPRPTP